MKPLSPAQVAEKAQTSIPDYIIEAVNNLLVKEYRNGSATISQKDILKEIRRIHSGTNLDVIFDNGWMDFEPTFRKAGWKVTYDKPAYCETYEPSYEFSK